MKQIHRGKFWAVSEVDSNGPRYVIEPIVGSNLLPWGWARSNVLNHAIAICNLLDALYLERR